MTLRIVAPATIEAVRRKPVDESTLAQAARIVQDVRSRGETALREHAERLGDIPVGGPLFVEAKAELSPEDLAVLERTLVRVQAFAKAQRECLWRLDLAIEGGRAGHEIAPVQRAGCYAPGGRYPLPSSVLMTAGVARVAEVESVWLASPRPAPATLAAAALCRVNGVLAAGGAHAIAALAYGAGPIEPCDVVAGPGNRWVTAAKKLVAGDVSIDMLAGPSELVVLADGLADPAVVAADLLAQAEHDPDALPVLVSLDRDLIDRVNQEIQTQLADLPTAEIAEQALRNGFAVYCETSDEAARVCDALAPEHLALHCEDRAIASKLHHYGALFAGERSAEVFGDYGAGPNHTLPTGGAARSYAGLSVFHFLRIRTWLELDRPELVAADAAALGRMEGLEAHARSAEMRRRT